MLVITAVFPVEMFSGLAFEIAQLTKKIEKRDVKRASIERGVLNTVKVLNFVVMKA